MTVNACRVCQRRAEQTVCDACVDRTMKLIAARRGLGAVWRFDLPDAIDEETLRSELAEILRSGGPEEPRMHLQLARLYRRAGQVRDALDEALLVLARAKGPMRDEAIAIIFDPELMPNGVAPLRDLLFK